MADMRIAYMYRIVAQKGHFRAEKSGIAHEVRHQADISGFLRLLAAKLKGVFEREQAVAHARCGNGRMLAAWHPSIFSGNERMLAALMRYLAASFGNQRQRASLSVNKLSRTCDAPISACWRHPTVMTGK